MLFPIGSSCINKFQRKDLRDETALIEEQFRLLHAVESNKYLSLSSELDSFDERKENQEWKVVSVLWHIMIKKMI